MSEAPESESSAEKAKPTTKRYILSRMAVVLALFGVAIIAGAALFHEFHKNTPNAYGWVDCFYWAIQVATTTGPGDITPKTDAAKILFMVYNLTVSVWLLLLVGANIVVRAIKNSDRFGDNEQEWTFLKLELIYDILRWQVLVLFRVGVRAGIEMPRMRYQRSDGSMPPGPRQPHDFENDDWTRKKAEEELAEYASSTPSRS